MFECVKSKSIEVRKNYLGQNVNLSDSITTQLEIFFVSGAAVDLNDWLFKVNSYVNIGTFLPTFTIYGITFTNCKIVSANFPTGPDFAQNAISRGSITLTIEETHPTSQALYSGDANYQSLMTLLETNAVYIKEISEEISYSSGLNGQFTLNHSVSVNPDPAAIASGTIASDLGLSIAGSILSSYLPGAGANNNSSLHSALASAGVEGNLSASINQITGEASYARTIDLLSTYDATTTSQRNHSLSLDAEGVITVTESGKVPALEMGVGSTNYAAAVAALPAILAAAQGRCTSVFGNYVGKLDSSAPTGANALNGWATEITQNFNEISQEVSYSISYSNDPTHFSGMTIDRTTDINKDANGITKISEKTSFIQHGTKCTSGDPLALYTSDNAGAFARIIAVYNSFNAGGTLDGGVAFTFKLASRDLDYSPNGKNLSYGISYTSDKSISASGSAAEAAGITRFSSNVSDKLPERMTQEYPIAPIGMLVHDSNQTSLGSRTVSLSANLDRSSSYDLANPAIPSAAITYLANQARTELLAVFADLGLANDDIFVSDCSYSFDAKRNVSLTATAQYLQTR